MIHMVACSVPLDHSRKPNVIGELSHQLNMTPPSSIDRPADSVAIHLQTSCARCCQKRDRSTSMTFSDAQLCVGPYRTRQETQKEWRGKVQARL